jgi:hypothetical protein
LAFEAPQASSLSYEDEAMNIGITTGAFSSAAGAPLAQTTGTETERSQKDSSVRERRADAEGKSERAAGIGTTEQDQGTEERDADGRRMWEEAGKKKDAAGEAEASEPERQAKDPTGQSGSALDLTG